MNEIIQIDNLTKSYGKKRGINHVSFTVKKGDVFGFLGPNGAGKSTTIRCLLGLIGIDHGSAKILDMDVSKENRKILEKVGYMPSEAMFYPSIRVADVIKFAADARNIDCSAEAEKLCERLQVDVKKRIEELSLGNRKKVSIVCAMQHKPELFIFDEPTSGLDPLMQSEFFRLLMEYNQDGATCFLSSHILSEVRTYCNKAAIIKEGNIICVDTIDHLSHTNAKKIRIMGIDNISLSNMEQLVKTEDGLEFVYHGDMNKLIDALHGKQIRNLLIEEPSLDEIFMQYYGKEQKP
jgi:ABC-2 type transport system ATP-binding protein